MNITIKKILFIAALFFSFNVSICQDNTMTIGEGLRVINNKVYKENSNYLTFGGGAAFNPKRKAFEQSYAFSYNFSLRNIALQAGYHVSSNDWFLNRSLQKLNDIHIGGGIRWEKDKSNTAILAGASYAYGADKNIVNDTVYYTAFTEFGLYVEYQMTYKAFYDVGFGATAFLSANTKYMICGIRLEFYFSPAYRREFY